MKRKPKIHKLLWIMLVGLFLPTLMYPVQSIKGQPSSEMIYREIQSFSAMEVLTDDNFSFISQVTWNPVNTLLAVGGYANSVSFIEIWDSLTPEIIYKLGEPHPAPEVIALEWSPDGQYLAVAYSNFDHIHLWHIGRDATFFTEFRHEGNVRSLTWSPDSTLLVSSSGDNSHGPRDLTEIRTVRVWEIQTGTALHEFPEDANRVIATQWQSGGHLLAASTWEAGVQIWDMDNIEITNSFPGYGSDWSIDVIPAYDSIVWNPNGEELASASCKPSECTMWTMDINSGSLSQLFRSDSQEYINDIAWHPSGEWLVSAGKDGSVITWDVETGEVIDSDILDGEAMSVDWSSDGQYLAAVSRNGTIKILELLLEQ